VVSTLPTSISTTSYITNLTSPLTEGTDYQNRLGRQVHWKHFHLSGQLVGGQSNLGTDENRNAVRLVVADIVAGSTPSITLSSILDPRTASQAGLIKVHFDRTFSLESPGRDSTGYMPSCREVVLNVPINRVQEFYGTGSGSGVGMNTVLFSVSDSAVVPNPGFVNGSSYLMFEDF
jgi:hypothetical protein